MEKFDIVYIQNKPSFPGVIKDGPNERGQFLIWWHARKDGLWMPEHSLVVATELELKKVGT